MVNKNRLLTEKVESDGKAVNPFMRLAEILAELLDTYPSSVEDILQALDKRICKFPNHADTHYHN